MEAEVEALVGPKGRHDPGRRAVRHGSDDGLVTLGGRQVAIRQPRVRSADGTAEVPLATYDCVTSTEVLGQRRLPVPLENLASGGGRSHDNTAGREGRATRARTARRRRATPPERTSTPCASSANVPPRPGKRPVRSHRWHTARLRGGVGPERVERPTSTRVDPGVTSSETARIRDRVRTGSSAGRTRSSCHASAFFAAAETARNVPRPVQSTGGSAEPICRTLW